MTASLQKSSQTVSYDPIISYLGSIGSFGHHAICLFSVCTYCRFSGIYTRGYRPCSSKNDIPCIPSLSATTALGFIVLSPFCSLSVTSPSTSTRAHVTTLYIVLTGRPNFVAAVQGVLSIFPVAVRRRSAQLPVSPPQHLRHT